MSKVPDRLYINKNDRDLYNKLIEEKMFNGRSNKELFLFAMAIGVKNGVPIDTDFNEGFIRAEYLNPEDEALLNAVALWHKGNPEVLTDKSEVYRIAQKYAHGGLRLLVDWIENTQYGTYEKHLEKILLDKYDEIIW
jgi:hypothetical protein